MVKWVRVCCRAWLEKVSSFSRGESATCQIGFGRGSSEGINVALLPCDGHATGVAFSSSDSVPVHHPEPPLIGRFFDSIRL